MHYILWAVLALLAYSLVPPLSKLAAQQLPIMFVALVANATITAVNLAVVVYLDEGSVASLSGCSPGAVDRQEWGVRSERGLRQSR